MEEQRGRNQKGWIGLLVTLVLTVLGGLVLLGIEYKYLQKKSCIVEITRKKVGVFSDRRYRYLVDVLERGTDVQVHGRAKTPIYRVFKACIVEALSGRSLKLRRYNRVRRKKDGSYRYIERRGGIRLAYDIKLSKEAATLCLKPIRYAYKVSYDKDGMRKQGWVSSSFLKGTIKCASVEDL